MKKKRTKKSLQKEADHVFSLFIRLRDRDDMGLTMCYTCPKRVDMKFMQAGHFVSRQHLRLRYDERNVHAQCGGCNGPYSGQVAAYSEHLVRDYGVEILLELKNLRDIPYPGFDYQKIIDLYTKKLDDMGMAYLI